MVKILKGITWNHTRGYTPMAASAQRFEELNPDVRIIWEKRSLQAFADEPIDQLAQRFDMLVIDHPWTGFAAHTGVIEALDNWLPTEFLQDQAQHSVGASHQSYHFNGQQWALAIDAATPVASIRPDMLDVMPDTWQELVKLAKQGQVAIPSIPQDTLMNFYMMCSTLGEDVCQQPDQVVSQDIGLQALQMLREVSAYLDVSCFDKNPIQIYEAMTLTDKFAYCPFAYGYANYAKKHYARKQLKFGDTVKLTGDNRLRTTLGGTGLAISAHSQHKAICAEYAQFVANAEMQSGFYVDFGGQPGHRQAWLAKDTNASTHNYFKDTLPTLDRAFLRPRYFGHMQFQDHSGTPIRDYLMNGGNEQALLNKLNQLYIESKGN